jgi:3,4-dihydroxy-9,10-secoandrosta-1,3,5(10)-triene-9,17-dione 4,5-dioxygenase
MSIRELGYVVIGSPDQSRWRWFGEQILGMAAVDGPDGTLYLRMDEHDYRLAIVRHPEERFIAAGWGVAEKRSFDDLRAKLVADGVAVESADTTALRIRRVHEMFYFRDPAGNRHEIFWGSIADFKPFVSPLGIASFVTGVLGLGHVVLPAPDIEAAYAFAAQSLGFGLSDILTMDFGGHAIKLYFLHCDNRRQHSLAFARMPAANGLVHMMIEVPTLKDVGMALDRVQKNNLQMAMTLGQHVNDECVSFYFLAPGGLMLEVGCHGVLKDWSRHSVFETTLPSHWGHQFVLHDPRYRVA